MGLGMIQMVDMAMLDSNPVALVNGVPQDEVPTFLRLTIREKKLTKIVTALNKEVLSADPARRDAAASALRRIGFV